MQKRTIIAGFLIAAIAGFFWAQSLHHVSDSTPSEVPRTNYSFQGLLIESINHQARGASENRPFSRYEGDAFGLDKYLDFSLLDFSSPFLRTSSIASGDFNNDGWQDIVLGNRRGILLYRNLGNRMFALQEVDIPEINNLNVLLVAFVDINNDGWQDVYFTSYGGNNYFIMNDQEGFQDPRVVHAPNQAAEVPQAVSFGDLNKDGLLDFVSGNTYIYTNSEVSPPLSAKNKIAMHTRWGFVEASLEEVIGPTLAVLLSDYTNDHNLDLIIGNDSGVPDIFYTGSGTGTLTKILASEGTIPISVVPNMGMDVADFNNDLFMDIYFSGISSQDRYSADLLKGSTRSRYCEIKNKTEKQKCENNLRIYEEIILQHDMERCYELQSPQKDQSDCKVMVMIKLVSQKRDESLCKKIPESYKTQATICSRYIASETARARRDSLQDIPQKIDGNVLLQGSKRGMFKDVSDKTGSGRGGWAWNAKFADLDNDEWQDIYIANGRWHETPPHSNVFFHNQGGQFFRMKQEEFHLENYNMVVAYTYVDLDNDGDLDIVTAGHNGPINVYLNNETENNSITFEFRDNKGNHFGIGNKVYIYYGENNARHQVREIKSGGGFLSFDAPIAHFGLGKYDRVHKIEIVWSTGEKTRLDKEFLANKNYVIERKK